MVAPQNKPHPGATRSNIVKALAASLACVAVVGELDRVTGPELALSIFYVFPVAVSAWFAGRWAGLGVALFAAAVWTFLDIHEGRPYSNPLIPYWNGGVRFAIF